MVEKKSHPGFGYICAGAATTDSVYVVVGKCLKEMVCGRKFFFFLDDVVLAGEMTGIEEGIWKFRKVV